MQRIPKTTTSPCSSSPRAGGVVLLPCACQDQMRDPWTVALSFVTPYSLGELRQASVFLKSCYEHAVYLESPLSIPWFSTILLDSSRSSSRRSSMSPVPVQMTRFGDLTTTATCRGAQSASRRAKSIPHQEPHQQPQPQTPAGGGGGGGASSTAAAKAATLEGGATESVMVGMTLCLTNIPSCLFLHLEPALGASVTHLTLAGLDKITCLPEWFLVNTTSLTHFVLRDCSTLADIGQGCLYACTSLEEVTFRNLPQLTSIGGDSISVGGKNNTSTLERLTLKDLPLLSQLGDSCPVGCLPDSRTSSLGFLRYFGIAGVPKLVSLGKDFMSSSPPPVGYTTVPGPTKHEQEQKKLSVIASGGPGEDEHQGGGVEAPTVLHLDIGIQVPAPIWKQIETVIRAAAAAGTGRKTIVRCSMEKEQPVVVVTVAMMEPSFSTDSNVEDGDEMSD